MVGSEGDRDGGGGETAAPTPDGGERDDGDTDPLATPRRRETLRVLAGRRLLSALGSAPDTDRDGGDVIDDDEDDMVLDPDGEADAESDAVPDPDGETDDTTEATDTPAPGPVVVEVDSLVEEVVARERTTPGRGSGDADHHRQVREALQTDHLPALASADVVAYDRDAGTVSYDGDPGVEARLHLR